MSNVKGEESKCGDEHEQTPSARLEFEAAARYVLAKNAELFRRLSGAKAQPPEEKSSSSKQMQ